MSLSKDILITIETLVVFSLIDFLWLGLIARKLYQKTIGFMMADKPNIVAAVIFYVLFAIGLNIFVINSNLKSHHFNDLLLKAALFGLFSYATFDLTSQAIFKRWPLLITIVDMLWGIILTTLTSLIIYEINIK